MQTPNSDQQQSAREHGARTRLLDAGASTLPRAPWLHRSQPPSTVDLVRFAVWRGQGDKVSDDEVMAVRHKQLPINGVQFHPESVLTPAGPQLAKNFLEGRR